MRSKTDRSVPFLLLFNIYFKTVVISYLLDTFLNWKQAAACLKSQWSFWNNDAYVIPLQYIWSSFIMIYWQNRTNNATTTHTGHTVNDELDEKYNCAALILNMDKMMTIGPTYQISTFRCWIYVGQSWCQRSSPEGSTRQQRDKLHLHPTFPGVINITSPIYKIIVYSFKSSCSVIATPTKRLNRSQKFTQHELDQYNKDTTRYVRV